MSTNPRQRPGREPDPNEELQKTEMAVRQLERAEMYVVSAINLELANPALRRSLHLLHGQLLETHELLRKPHLAG